MDERRFRIYVSIIVGVFAFSFIRVLTETNPIYDAGEPIFSRLNEFSADIALVDESTGSPSQAMQSENDRLMQENVKLREQLDLRTDRPTVSAEVTRRDIQGYKKQVWINVGNNSSVTPGQTVIHNNALFGVVERVFDESAVVRTVLDPDFRATVVIDGQQGILKVDYGALVADLVPSKNLVGQGVTTDGLDGLITSGVNVGITNSLVGGTSEVFGSYNVLLPYSLFDVTFVEVIKTELQP